MTIAPEVNGIRGPGGVIKTLAAAARGELVVELIAGGTAHLRDVVRCTVNA